MVVKVTTPWGYIRVLLLNIKGHYNICHLFPYCVYSKRTVVSLIEFKCVGDVPRYLEAILVGNIIHSRLHFSDNFIFLLQSELIPPCECHFVYQLISFRILFSLDSMWFLHILHWHPWVFPILPLYVRVPSFVSLFTIPVSVSWYRKHFTIWQCSAIWLVTADVIHKLILMTLFIHLRIYVLCYSVCCILVNRSIWEHNIIYLGVQDLVVIELSNSLPLIVPTKSYNSYGF